MEGVAFLTLCSNPYELSLMKSIYKVLRAHIWKWAQRPYTQNLKNMKVRCENRQNTPSRLRPGGAGRPLRSIVAPRGQGRRLAAPPKSTAERGKEEVPLSLPWRWPRVPAAALGRKAGSARGRRRWTSCTRSTWCRRSCTSSSARSSRASASASTSRSHLDPYQ